MVSKTEKTYRIRKKKKTKKGKIRKRYLRVHGSTPSFPIHPEKPAINQESKEN